MYSTTMSLVEYTCYFPFEDKLNILFDLPLETISCIDFDYFWYLYCKKNKVNKKQSLPFTSWKDTYMEYYSYKVLSNLEYRLSFLKS